MKQMHVFLVFLAITTLLACTKENVQPETEQEEVQALTFRQNPPKERVVIANRSSRSISVLDAATNALLYTKEMPDNGMPMYAVHIPQAKAVFVGDRENNRVVAFDEDNFSVKGTVPAGAGVFHMWASPNGNQLWVNNDIDNTTTIINPVSMKVKGLADTPADLVALGGKPHDVFVDPDKKFAYVTVLGVSGAHDYVVKYNTNRYEEVGRVTVGKDPHLFADDVNDLLYVPCQNTNNIYVINRNTLAVETVLPFAGAHGVYMPGSGSYIYVSNISGAGIGVFETGSNTPLGTINTPLPVPHNLTVNAAESKLFVTHSGATADQVSIYTLDPLPQLETTVTVENNPFGLVYYTY